MALNDLPTSVRFPIDKRMPDSRLRVLKRGLAGTFTRQSNFNMEWQIYCPTINLMEPPYSSRFLRPAKYGVELNLALGLQSTSIGVELSGRARNLIKCCSACSERILQPLAQRKGSWLSLTKDSSLPWIFSSSCHRLISRQRFLIFIESRFYDILVGRVNFKFFMHVRAFPPSFPLCIWAVN